MERGRLNKSQSVNQHPGEVRQSSLGRKVNLHPGEVNLHCWEETLRPQSSPINLAELHCSLWNHQTLSIESLACNQIHIKALTKVDETRSSEKFQLSRSISKEHHTVVDSALECTRVSTGHSSELCTAAPMLKQVGAWQKITLYSICSAAV